MPVEIETMIYKKVKKVSCGGRMTAACVIRSWVQDQEAKTCMACKLQFTTLRRRVSIRICNSSTTLRPASRGLRMWHSHRQHFLLSLSTKLVRMDLGSHALACAQPQASSTGKIFPLEDC